MGHVATICAGSDIRGAILRELGHDLLRHAGYAVPNGAARTYSPICKTKGKTIWGNEDAQEDNNNAHF